MDELDSRIREALIDLSASAVGGRVVDTVSSRLEQPTIGPRPRFLAMPGLAMAAALAVVIAVTGVLFVSRQQPISPSTSPTVGSTPDVRRTDAVGRDGPPRYVWSEQPLDGDAVGHGRMEAIVRASTGLVAGGWVLDTSHHHNTSTTERHHVEAVIWTSSDGNHWLRVETLAGAEQATITTLAAAGGIVIAAGNADVAGSTAPRFWRSIEGEDWEEISTSGLPAGSVVGALGATPHGFLLGVTASAEGGAQSGGLWYSADGVAWDEVDVGDGSTAESWSVFPTIEGLVAVGYRIGRGPVISRSNDGRNWRSVEVADGAFGADFVGLDDLIAGGPEFIAAGRVVDTVSPQDPASTRLGPPTDGAIWTSTDLATWTRVEPSRNLFGGEHDDTVTDLVAVVGGYVAVGSSGEVGAVWSSSDGVKWHRLMADDAPFAHGAPAAVLALGAKLVAVGGDIQGAPLVWRGRRAADRAGAGDFDALVASRQGSGPDVALHDRFIPAPVPAVPDDDGRRLYLISLRGTAGWWPATPRPLPRNALSRRLFGLASSGLFQLNGSASTAIAGGNPARSRRPGCVNFPSGSSVPQRAVSSA